jgi:hypothetical protein
VTLTILEELRKRLYTVINQQLSDINVITVKPMGAGVINKKPYDSVYIALQHREYWDGDGPPLVERLWQGSFPWDGSQKSTDEIYQEMNQWMFAVVAEYELRHKISRREMINTHDPKFRYTIPRGEDTWPSKTWKM